jgi:hypothetical protein
MAIYVILLGRGTPNETWFGITEEYTRRGHLTQILRRDRSLAGFAFLDDCIGSNKGDRVIVDAEARQVRDVASGAVTELGDDTKLLGRRWRIKDIVRRKYFQTFEHRSIGRIIAGALGDPAEEQFVLHIAGRQSLSAFVGRLPRRFPKKETGGRIEQVQAATVDLARQGQDIKSRIVAA